MKMAALVDPHGALPNYDMRNSWAKAYVAARTDPGLIAVCSLARGGLH